MTTNSATNEQRLVLVIMVSFHLWFIFRLTGWSFTITVRLQKLHTCVVINLIARISGTCSFLTLHFRGMLRLEVHEGLLIRSALLEIVVKNIGCGKFVTQSKPTQ